MKNSHEYHEKFIFEKGDLDDKGVIKVSRLLYHFQDIASHHVASKGCGIEDIIKDNYIWVLSKMKYRLYEELDESKEYLISTCQRKKKAVTFLRDYFIYDENERVVAEGSSQWCVLNFVTRKVEKVDFGVENVHHPSEYIDEGFDKIRISCDKVSGKHTINHEDLDENAHTNNCRYADFITMVTGQSHCRDFSIYFSKESLEGDEINFFTENQDGYTAIEGRLADGSIIFQAKMK